MGISPRRFLKLSGIYLDKYTAIPEAADMAALLQIAADYDAWFSDKAIPAIESMLTITGGVWQPDPMVPAAVGRLVQDGAARIILDGVSRWCTEDGDNKNNLPQYFKPLLEEKFNKKKMLKLLLLQKYNKFLGRKEQTSYNKI